MNPGSRRQKDTTRLQEEFRGENGQVIRLFEKDKNQGIVRFAVPKQGKEEWPFYSKDPVQVGDRVWVTRAEAEGLLVEKKCKGIENPSTLPL